MGRPAEPAERPGVGGFDSQGRPDSLSELQGAVVAFSRRRGWDMQPHHLAISVAVEAAELLEVYQWYREGESLAPQRRQEMALECADVLAYLLQLCAAEGIDLAAALRRKVEINAVRFPEPDRPGTGRR